MKQGGLAEATRESTAQDDFAYAIGLNRSIFIPLGVWPLNDNPSRSEVVTRRIRLFFTSFILLLYVAPQYCYLLSQPAVEEFFKVVSEHVVYVLSIIKLIIYVLNSDEIGYCIGRMKEDWNDVRPIKDRETMIRYAKFGRYMAICCVSCTYSGICFYTLFVPFLKDPSTKIVGNVSVAERPLPYRINYIIFDAETTPIYEITWVIQFVGMSFSCFLNCGSHALTGALVAHACGQLRVIGSQLEKLVDANHTEDNRSVQQRLGGMVQQHLRVIRYTARINQSLQVFFLTEEVGTLTIICFLAYLLLLAKNDANNSTLFTVLFSFILCAFTFNFFVISIAGQQLWEESEAVVSAIYRVQWYRLHPKVARSLIICMVRAAQPLKLSACNMFDMSLTNFGDVVRGAYVFLNVVRKTVGLD